MQKLGKSLLTILMTTSCASLAAAPLAYSINSDSGTLNADSLYRIDLATGVETRIAPVQSLGETRIDVEGLAFAPDGTLYGVDDSAMTFFPLNPDNAVVIASNEVSIKGLPAGGGNDFGMSFACDNNLYLTSVATGSLYRMDLAGNATQIGNDGDLGFNISALAAFGNPVRLYGLGNGLDGNLAVDSPNLYEIDISTGIAVEIGPLGPAAGSYSEGGLAFDDSGQLWAITDRRQLNMPSQVMKVDLASGTASEVKNTTEAGFESLAVTVPRGCQTGGNGQIAEFKVQKQFVDDNDQTPVTLNIRCFTGVPLEQSLTVLPNDGPFGNFEVKFIVEEFEDGTLNCEVWESAPENYGGSYECFSEGNCEIVESMCVFDGVNMGQDNLCVIRNYPDPVMITVTSEWLYDSEEYVPEDSVTVDLTCRNVFDGDGEPENGSMRWTWTFENESPGQVATVYPDWEGSTDCRIETQPGNSAVETTSSCSEWTPILLGGGPLTCTVTNSVFFEGIPTLNQYGLLLLSLLMLFAGTIALRRF